jgi:hypothetical protein
MGQRIVFEFLELVDRAPEQWARVQQIIEEAGGTHLSELAGKPPYLVTAVLPDENQAAQVVARLRETPGVGRADLDQWRRAFALGFADEASGMQPDKLEPDRPKKSRKGAENATQDESQEKR